MGFFLLAERGRGEDFPIQTEEEKYQTRKKGKLIVLYVKV
jgi:hypothetical protein